MHPRVQQVIWHSNSNKGLISKGILFFSGHPVQYIEPALTNMLRIYPVGIITDYLFGKFRSVSIITLTTFLYNRVLIQNSD
jgi:hypothetical protein